MGYAGDNLINYNVGPVYIAVCGWRKTIQLSTGLEWVDVLQEVGDIAIKLWGVMPEDIILQKPNIIIIKYNVEIISKYLEENIVII